MILTYLILHFLLFILLNLSNSFAFLFYSLIFKFISSLYPLKSNVSTTYRFLSTSSYLLKSSMSYINVYIIEAIFKSYLNCLRDPIYALQAGHSFLLFSILLYSYISILNYIRHLIYDRAFFQISHIKIHSVA
jgi:hypothetical protein